MDHKKDSMPTFILWLPVVLRQVECFIIYLQILVVWMSHFGPALISQIYSRNIGSLLLVFFNKKWKKKNVFSTCFTCSQLHHPARKQEQRSCQAPIHTNGILALLCWRIIPFEKLRRKFIHVTKIVLYPLNHFFFRHCPL